jgi:hypothetical protein
MLELVRAKDLCTDYFGQKNSGQNIGEGGGGLDACPHMPFGGTQMSERRILLFFAHIRKTDKDHFQSEVVFRIHLFDK